jgi:cysteinyl-tRNA synthetase
MHIYDSVAKTKRVFEPLIEGKVSLYVCGPTVYDDAHLGHAKSALVFDLLRRVLEAEGFAVTYARNITDIDDKIIKKSAEAGIPIAELTDTYTEAYHRDMAALGVQRPTLEPRATESLEAMFDLIGKLMDKGHAYQTSNGDVYFDTGSDSAYLSISNRRQDETDTQQRVESFEEKRHAADFALWKSVHDDSIAFESPFGTGRPGWHTECSAMIEKHLSTHMRFAIDIHGGGADLLFPHHENEAAQTRCATGQELANYWMHNGFVTIGGEKMSKSLGNSFFIKDALKVYPGEVLRFFLLGTHYRSDFNFNEEDLLASKKRLDRLYRLKKRLFGLKVVEEKTPFQTELLNALSDDLNISRALSLLDEMSASANERLDEEPKNKGLKRTVLADLAYVESLLGFGTMNPYEYFQHGIDAETKTKIDTLIEARNAAKKAKDFARSDAIRDEISALGVQLMDTPQGTFWEKAD